MASLSELALAVEPDSVTSPSARPPMVDALGYHPGSVMYGSLALRVAPVSGAMLSWTSEARDLDLGPGTVHTGFILSGLTEQLFVLWCNDLTQGQLFADCALLGQ
jgi:hypothetical protein